MDKIIATYKGQMFTENGERLLSLATPYDFVLEKGKEYTITFSEKKPKRSLQQNALMWELLNRIALAEDGSLADVENIYLQCLEMAGASSTVVTLQEIALDTFKRMYRHIKVLDRFMYRNKPYVAVQAFTGSSQLNTAEMAQLIDVVIKRAEENGIYSEYYEELLKR